MELSKLHEIKVDYCKSYSNDMITDSKKALSVAKEIYRITNSNIHLKEYFSIILMNRRNEVIGYYILSEGGLSGTVVDIRLAYSVALKCLASGMILVHNHPSGNASPSSADIRLTRKFVDAGKLLDINVLDHIIITEDSYHSMADNGEL